MGTGLACILNFFFHQNSEKPQDSFDYLTVRRISLTGIYGIKKISVKICYTLREIKRLKISKVGFRCVCVLNSPLPVVEGGGGDFMYFWVGVYNSDPRTFCRDRT